MMICAAVRRVVEQALVGAGTLEQSYNPGESMKLRFLQSRAPDVIGGIRIGAPIQQ